MQRILGVVFFVVGSTFVSPISSEAQQAFPQGYPGAAAPAQQFPDLVRPYGVVPGPPSQPYPTQRPASWPGNAALSNAAAPNQSDARSGYPPTTPLGPNVYSNQGSMYSGMGYSGMGQPGRGAPRQYGPSNRQRPGMAPPSRIAGRTPRRPTLPRQPLPEAAVPCDTARIVGWVGSDVILASELIVGIDTLLENYKKTAESPVPAEAITAQREQLISMVMQGVQESLAADFDPNTMTKGQRERRNLVKRLLKQCIETKLVCYDARRKIPEEGLPRVEKSLRQQFEQKALPIMIKEANVKNRNELDAKLRASGGSLERVKMAFVDRTLAQGWVREQLADNEITFDQRLEYYHKNKSDFEKEGRARWEELAVRFSEFPTEREAYAAIVQMGNRVARDNVPLAEVAKAASNGLTASEGGTRDWTTQGSLVSKNLEQVVFGLPVGRLSQIIRTKKGFQIIRVIEREDAGCTPFVDAQVAIKAKIQQERIGKRINEYLDQLHEEIPVKTIVDDPETATHMSGRSGATWR